MSYLFIQSTEDGTSVNVIATDLKAQEYIRELTDEDIMPEHRAVFVDTPPNDYSPPNHVFVFKGEFVIPQPIKTVTEWRL